MMRDSPRITNRKQGELLVTHLACCLSIASIVCMGSAALVLLFALTPGNPHAHTHTHIHTHSLL